MDGRNIYQGTPEWFNDRLFHFTSSELYKLMTKPKSKQDQEAGKPSKTAEEYIFEKLAEDLTGRYNDSLDTKAMKWGETYEPEARIAYESASGNKVDLCGFIEWSRMFGGSPDGLVGEDGIIEIKCPFNSSNHVRYLLLENQYELNGLKPEYYAQIQGNLLVTGRKWCDFISYDPRCVRAEFGLKILRVNRDEEFIKRIKEALDRAEAIKEQITGRIIRNVYDKFMRV